MVAHLSNKFPGSPVRVRLRVDNVEVGVVEGPLEPQRLRDAGGRASERLLRVHRHLGVIVWWTMLENIFFRPKIGR